MTRGCTRRLIWGAVFGFMSLVALSTAQDVGGLVAVSKPPAPVVPSDPAQGLLFDLNADMSASAPMFDTAGGPIVLNYLSFDPEGNAYLSFDDGPSEAAPGGIMVVNDFLARANSTFDPSQDRLITGRQSGLDKPKDLIVLEDEGVIIVSDFGAAKLAVFDAAREGDATPLFETTDLGVTESGDPRRPWGLAYDPTNDRLYVGGTDGVLLVYQDYLTKQGSGGPDTLVAPSLNGEKVSANLHDLVYDAESNVLILSDVGSATTADQTGFDSDGSVLVIAAPNLAEGPTEVQLVLAGANTLLGNPVGLAFDGTNLYVSEKTKDVILRFDGLLSLEQTADIFPSAVVTVPQPEGIILEPKN